MMLVLVVAAALVTADAPIRTWTDTTGRFTVEASLVGVENDRVMLEKVDGSRVAIPVDKLSETDRQWMKSQESPAVESGDPFRTQRMQEIDRLRQRIAEAEHAAREAQRRRDEQRARQLADDVRALRHQIKLVEDARWTPLLPLQIKVGDAGRFGVADHRLAFEVRVVRVVSRTEVLAGCRISEVARIPDGSTGNMRVEFRDPKDYPPFLLRGVNTARLKPGGTMSVSGAYEVTGMYQYVDTEGVQRSAPVLETMKR